MNNSEKRLWQIGKRAIEKLKRIKERCQNDFFIKTLSLCQFNVGLQQREVQNINKFDLFMQLKKLIIEKYKKGKIKFKSIDIGDKCIQISNICDSWFSDLGNPDVDKQSQNQIKLNKRKAIANLTVSPYTTKNVVGMKIYDKPLAYLVDTVGVMIPNTTQEEQGIKLGLIGGIKNIIRNRILDNLVNQQQMEKLKTGDQYILAISVKNNHYKYETAIDLI